MRFVKRDNLKTGMRLARPIYNKNGVLLYERNSKLTRQGIESIRNFGLIGIFILEPAEPVPPMTQADLETVIMLIPHKRADTSIPADSGTPLMALLANTIHAPVTAYIKTDLRLIFNGIRSL